MSDSIDDASATKPYVMVLAPGRFDLGATPLMLPDYVSIVGAGSTATTILTTDTTTNIHHLVRPGNQSAVRDLKLAATNLGASIYVNGIFPQGGSTSYIEDVRIELLGMNPSSFGVMTHGSAGAPATVYLNRVEMTMSGSGGSAPMPVDAEGAGNVHISHSRLVAPGKSRTVLGFDGAVTVAYTALTGGAEVFGAGATLACAYSRRRPACRLHPRLPAPELTGDAPFA